MSSTQTQAYTQLANTLADASATVIQDYFRGDIGVEYKEANSPIVTLADQAAERAMREVLAKQAPEHAIYGEEYGYPEGNPEHSWILDPIDGTIAFSSGKPTFTTLIGYAHNDDFEMGIINQPISGERWVGIKGEGAYFNGKKISPSTKTNLAHCNISSSSPYTFPAEKRHILEAIIAEAHVYSAGGDSYNYGLVAMGCIDICIDYGLALHDFAAVVPIVEASGACITDWKGNPINKQYSDGNIVMTGNPELHKQVLAIINR